MSLWNKSVHLTSHRLELVPLDLKHHDDLCLAVEDGQLWRLWFTSVPHPNDVAAYIKKALNEYECQRSIPFAIIDSTSGKAIGSTRFCNLVPRHNRLEIGYTFYAKSYQRTAFNTQAKYLLLTYAFEQLDCIAVEFRTHWHNHKSRSAIARLGAKQDGILRNHMKSPDGLLRDTVIFSIIESEWPAIKAGLTFKLSDDASYY